MPLNRKAQIFTWDIILATVIFLIVLGTILFLWTDTLEDIDAADTEYELSWLATAVSEQLARTPGSPYNWTQSPNIGNITVLGLADTEQIGNETITLDRVLDPDKIVAFIDLAQKSNGYSPLRNRLFGTGKYDFYVEISCLDSTVLDCFEGLRLDNLVNYNVSCNASNTTLYVSNHTMKSDSYLSGIWRFDEGVDNLTGDSSGEGNDATINGASWTTGKYGSALNFDGTNDYVEATPQTTVSGAFTVAAWVTISDDSARTILSTRGPSEYGFDMELRNGNEINASIGTGTAWLAPTANVTFSYDHDRWYHIAYAVNQTGYRIFINGTLVKTGTYAGTPLLYDVNHTLDIGRKQSGTDYFKGAIDEVKVWRRALNDTEVLSEYARAEKYCRFGRNVSMSDASYQIYDSKTVTFRKGTNESIFDDDTAFIEPTATLKVVVYRTSF
jgi:hypothetical protein